MSFFKFWVLLSLFSFASLMVILGRDQKCIKSTLVYRIDNEKTGNTIPSCLSKKRAMSISNEEKALIQSIERVSRKIENFKKKYSVQSELPVILILSEEEAKNSGNKIYLSDPFDESKIEDLLLWSAFRKRSFLFKKIYSFYLFDKRDFNSDLSSRLQYVFSKKEICKTNYLTAEEQKKCMTLENGYSVSEKSVELLFLSHFFYRYDKLTLREKLRFHKNLPNRMNNLKTPQLSQLSQLESAVFEKEKEFWGLKISRLPSVLEKYKLVDQFEVGKKILQKSKHHFFNGYNNSIFNTESLKVKKIVSSFILPAKDIGLLNADFFEVEGLGTYHIPSYRLAIKLDPNVFKSRQLAKQITSLLGWYPFWPAHIDRPQSMSVN